MFKAGKLKRALTLLSLGGTTFVCLSLPSLPGLPTADFGGLSCCGVTNTNLTDFYQGVCAAGIAEFADTTRDVLPFPEGGDFDTIVVTPVETFWTSLCNNCTAQQFPLDVGDANWLE
ncbi:MAG: hypothetical protein KKI02_12075 [Planctomycetes bacterium]|nr:hypothetical protein [Planctomycetota bacterium]